jgi:hypothetical protein
MMEGLLVPGPQVVRVLALFASVLSATSVGRGIPFKLANLLLSFAFDEK